MSERSFPIRIRTEQDERAAGELRSIPYEVAREAHKTYVLDCGGLEPLRAILQRGGFTPSELDRYRPGWREVLP